MEKIFPQIPITNAIVLIILAALMALANYKNHEIAVAVWITFTLAMVIWPGVTEKFVFGSYYYSIHQKLFFYFAGSFVLLQQNTYHVFRDITVGLFFVGHRAIELLVNSVRSLV